MLENKKYYVQGKIKKIQTGRRGLGRGGHTWTLASFIDTYSYFTEN